MHWLSSADGQMVQRLFLATIFGSVIGLEREIHGKVAGFRTHALVSLGAALIMVISIDLYSAYRGLVAVDPSRIAAQVVSGIGFLGAGAIIRFKSGISGLTTAASLWVASAIGLACGAGFFKHALAAVVLALLILAVFGTLGKWLGWKDI